VPEGSPAKPAILVSACLLGVCCNHRGEANPSDAVQALAADARLIPVCPETMGGLPTPRPAAEQVADGRMMNEEGVDVTGAFTRGARATVELARVMRVRAAVLKARSPSCGEQGMTTLALRAAGVGVRSEEEAVAEPSTLEPPTGA
jgi:uncharacterized protein YbbK (DUF523 family)